VERRTNILVLAIPRFPFALGQLRYAALSIPWSFTEVNGASQQLSRLHMLL
jgi:hypothetical protein